ncbi:MAG: contractile injection system tape measure protein, partial [Pseudomonadota bacterium]
HGRAPVPTADEAAETNAGTHHHASAPPTDEVAEIYVGAHGRAPVLTLLSGIQQRAQKRLEDCHLPEAIQRVQDVIALSEQVQAKQQDTGWACQDAGLVLLWPHLKTLFSRLKLLDADSAFVDDAAQRKAQALLIALLGTEPCAEVWCVANILIGLPADTLVFEPVPLSPDELNQCDQLLSAVIAQWSALKQMSVPAFRDLFLLRTGVLRPDDQGLRLEVKKHPADVLLSKLPWGIGIIALPWLPGKLLRVDWSDGLS